ncbi:Ribonuclease H [compost metagenome]
MKEVTIYTDGACSGNPGSGGWAAILKYGEHTKEIWDGPVGGTTNIKMEMAAVYYALDALKEPCKVTMYTDLQLIFDAFNKRWLDSWVNNGWNNSKGKPVANADIWEGIFNVAARHDVTVVKVKGHSGDPINERCDQLAKAAIAG